MGNEIVPYDPSKVLKKKTPKAAIYTRPGPYGRDLAYVPWAYVARQMNEAFGSSWTLRYIADPKMQGGEVLVMIEISTPDGSQQAYGSHKYQQSNPNASYGDALQSATSKALRRACARWGIALDLYLNDTDDETDEVREMHQYVVTQAKMLGRDTRAIETTVAAEIEKGRDPFEVWSGVAATLEE